MSEKWGQKNENEPLGGKQGGGVSYFYDPDFSDLKTTNHPKL
jgi:hypothetical protein